ncbi:MAG: hypothetical protein AAF961_19995, partial [Planctomycetota bacterium]
MTRLPVHSCLTLFLFAFFVNVGPASTGAFDKLLSRVPPDANALVLIDVESTLAAPIAQRQGWARKLETAYVKRPVFLPPEAKRLALAADLDPARDFLGRWEIALMETPEPPSMRSI